AGRGSEDGRKAERGGTHGGGMNRQVCPRLEGPGGTASLAVRRRARLSVGRRWRLRWASTAAARASCVASSATYDEVRRLLVMIDKKVAMRSRTRRKARSNRLDPPVAAFRAAQE